MYVYSIPPIDLGWHNLATVGHLPRHIETIASALGWEGDVVGCIRTFFVPVDDGFRQGYVWKQHNNGTSFVASPVRFEHLDNSCFNREFYGDA
jgi:hypothetical protein